MVSAVRHGSPCSATAASTTKRKSMKTFFFALSIFMFATAFVIILYCGIDRIAYHPEWTEAQLLRNRLGLYAIAIVSMIAGYVASLTWSKDK